jgi:hypothetical protein
LSSNSSSTADQPKNQCYKTELSHWPINMESISKFIELTTHNPERKKQYHWLNQIAKASIISF